MAKEANNQAKIVLTGDRPTGHLHVGHYVGSLRNRVKLQEEYQQYSKFHSITAFYRISKHLIT